jgi:AraC-like DNA-binding protein
MPLGISLGKTNKMIASGTATFTNPGDYQANFIGANINLALTGSGEFKARLTWINLRGLRLVRSRETLPRISFVKFAPGTVVVAFPTSFDPPQIWGGAKLVRGAFIFHSVGERVHQRTSGASQWGFISLAAKDLAACGRILTGIDLVAPAGARLLRTPSVAGANLSRLFAQACRLAETKPDIFMHRESARALEHDLVHALVHCLAAEDAREQTAAGRRHASIMVRFEEVLAAHCGRQLHTRELRAAVAVPERTLGICCAEFVGMSPGSYIRIRRLNLARAALLRADPATASVREIARRYGFSELGRFAAVYRGAFGEAPSATLCGIH